MDGWVKNEHYNSCTDMYKQNMSTCCVCWTHSDCYDILYMHKRTHTVHAQEEIQPWTKCEFQVFKLPFPYFDRWQREKPVIYICYMSFVHQDESQTNKNSPQRCTCAQFKSSARAKQTLQCSHSFPLSNSLNFPITCFHTFCLLY